MRYSLIDLASVNRQTSLASFELVFKSSLMKRSHVVPEPIMVAIAIIITRAYRAAAEHVISYADHEFVCPALNYDQYLELKAAWQWLTKDDYTMFNKVHSADFSKQEYFWRRKLERKSSLFNGCEVYLVIPTLSSKLVQGRILVRETRICNDLLEDTAEVPTGMNFLRRKEA